MKIKDPKVTLKDDARIGTKEDVRSGFLDWLFTCNVVGDDGERYEFGTSILSMHVEQIDLVTMFLAKGFGHSEQLPNSIYKIGRYPGTIVSKRFRNPAGSLKVESFEDKVVVSISPYYRAECYDNGSWHITADSQDGFSLEPVDTI